jgi:MerR family transcriptional regulator, copper efflux regulator
LSSDQITSQMALSSNFVSTAADPKIDRTQMHDMAKTLRHLAEHCQGDDRPHRPIVEELSSGRDAGAAKPNRRAKYRTPEAQKLRSAL